LSYGVLSAILAANVVFGVGGEGGSYGPRGLRAVSWEDLEAAPRGSSSCAATVTRGQHRFSERLRADLSNGLAHPTRTRSHIRPDRGTRGRARWRSPGRLRTRSLGRRPGSLASCGERQRRDQPPRRALFRGAPASTARPRGCQIRCGRSVISRTLPMETPRAHLQIQRQDPAFPRSGNPLKAFALEQPLVPAIPRPSGPKMARQRDA